MDEPPVDLGGKKKRLKSLDEFEAPYWKGQFHRQREAFPYVIVVVGLAVGAAIGLLIL